MKRFALTGTAFFFAALVGIGLSVSMAPSTDAEICDPSARQWNVVCGDSECSAHAGTPHGLYSCGTEILSGHYCSCYRVACINVCDIPEQAPPPQQGQ